MIFIAALGCPSFAQSPIANIGFEKGNFDGWDCFIGQAPSTSNNNPYPGYPSHLEFSPGRHNLISGESYQELDPYGNFPIVCPNGSNYTVQLGNSGTRGENESMTYTFTVPANAQDFQIVYHYAVVLENPPEHTESEQPSFQANVYDMETNTTIPCGSFTFISSSSLPGFERSSVRGNANGGGGGTPAVIYYKPWAAVSLNLSGYAGKTLKLEFRTSDCTRGGHFGYAYIDVDESYFTPISGSVICQEPAPGTMLTLSGPVGFREYQWYKADDLARIIGADRELQVPAAAGDRYALKIFPYPGFGCESTVYATISQSFEQLVLNLPPVIQGCDYVDLTDPKWVEGSTSSFVYTYYRDPELTQLVPNALKLTQSGRFYVKGTARSGCVLSKGVDVVVNRPPALFVTPPAPLCGVGITADITLPAITAGSDPAAVMTYWKDPAAASQPLDNPRAIPVSGIYYIKATNPSTGCFSIQQVPVVIESPPTVITHDQIGCKSIDLTAQSVVSGSSPGISFTYFTDAAMLQPVANPKAVTASGTYYIRGATSYGCSTLKPINVTVYVDPVISFTDPVPVIYPATIDLTAVTPPGSQLTFSFFTDRAATAILKNPSAVGITGTYYIKSTNAGGCFTVQAVNVLIHPPENPVVTSINTFTPNGDGVNDNFKLDITGYLRVKYFRIFTRWGEPVFETLDLNLPWDGRTNGKDAGAGTYYWVFDSVDEFRNKEVKRSGTITLIR